MTASLASVLGQAVLAGLFVTGDVGMLAWHRGNGGLLHGLVVVQAFVAIPLWRPGRGPLWPVLASFALVALVATQYSVGEDRALAVHIPLGVTIFGLSTLLTAWSWLSAGRTK